MGIQSDRLPLVKFTGYFIVSQAFQYPYSFFSLIDTALLKQITFLPEADIHLVTHSFRTGIVFFLRCKYELLKMVSLLLKELVTLFIFNERSVHQAIK